VRLDTIHIHTSFRQCAHIREKTINIDSSFFCILSSPSVGIFFILRFSLLFFLSPFSRLVLHKLSCCFLFFLSLSLTGVLVTMIAIASSAFFKFILYIPPIFETDRSRVTSIRIINTLSSASPIYNRQTDGQICTYCQMSFFVMMLRLKK